MKLIGLHQVDGCLEAMISDTSGPLEIYLGWIARLQGSVYPIRTRRLKQRDVRILENNLDDEFVELENDELNGHEE